MQHQCKISFCYSLAISASCSRLARLRHCREAFQERLVGGKVKKQPQTDNKHLQAVVSHRGKSPQKMPLDNDVDISLRCSFAFLLRCCCCCCCCSPHCEKWGEATSSLTHSLTHKELSTPHHDDLRRTLPKTPTTHHDDSRRTLSRNTHEEHSRRRLSNTHPPAAKAHEAYSHTAIEGAFPVSGLIEEVSRVGQGRC